MMRDPHSVFLEIAEQMTLAADLTIAHSHYPAWTVADLLRDRLLASPREIQAKFLCAQLQTYLHCIYFSRSLLPIADVVETTAPINLPLISNNLMQGVDTAFYAQIDQANCSQGYYDVDWTIAGEEDDGLVAVVKDGLCLHVWPAYLHPDDQTLAVGERAAVVMPKNLLTIDRYIAISNYGRVCQLPVTSLYWSCPALVAIELIKEITTSLNTLRLPFELQVQLALDQYQQTDSLILRLAAVDYGTAQFALSDIYLNHRSQFYDQTPIFTEPVTTGVGFTQLAVDQQGVLQLWQPVAQALSECWLLEITDNAVKLERMLQALTLLDLSISKIDVSDANKFGE
jgi:HopA1 effector protein family